MRLSQVIVCLGVSWLLSLAMPLNAQLLIEETFSGYLDNALISDSPAGPAVGLAGDWTLTPNSDFFVNKTRDDDGAGTGKAVYERPPGDNGSREAMRSTSADHVLLSNDGDIFYASFLINPALANGRMTFKLLLNGLDGGGSPDFSFGIVDGSYIVGNGGIDIDASGGTVVNSEQLVVVRIEYGAGNSGPDDSEVVTVWVDPVSEGSAPAINAASIDFLNRGGVKVAGVSIRGEQMAGHPAFFDDLRVGFSFSDVVVSDNCILDIDANGNDDALTDGILVLRHLFGISGDPLIADALAPDATRTDPQEITDYLTGCCPDMLDVDANGQCDALTDGLLVLRYLFGFSGPTLTDDALAPDATRTDPTDISLFLDQFAQ